jgi:N-acetylmuramoyl-L-alanine amidase
VRRLLLPTASVALALGTCVAAAAPVQAPDAAPSPASRAAEPAEEEPPLAGARIVLDPGHQLGNRNFPRKIARQVPAGGFTKPCNTPGTATDGGWPEATFTWLVATRLKARLEHLGATVRMTRSTNSAQRWGPCVDVRGRAGNPWPADLKISVHADGSYAAEAHGFHVISPTDRQGWTHDIAADSLRLAKRVRNGLVDRGVAKSTYVGAGSGLDRRGDLATLNLSDIPTVLVELGNMRHPGDAKRMRSPKGRQDYVLALASAIRTFLR